MGQLQDLQQKLQWQRLTDFN
ncbi:hypothetical protein CCP4SC76_4750011 [Gammaproteobacteria bacterium]